MTREDLLNSILAEWAKNKPLTKESAMETVRTVLADYPKEMSSFGKWFEKNGDIIVDKINA